MTTTAESTGRFSAFSSPGFPAYWAAIMLTGFAVQIQTVSVGWYVYDLTRNPFDLGLVGLSQFLPALMLVVVTSVCADPPNLASGPNDNTTPPGRARQGRSTRPALGFAST